MKIVQGNGGGGGGGFSGMTGDGSALERVLLDAARHERPAPELVTNMERALGIGAPVTPLIPSPPASTATAPAGAAAAGTMTKAALVAWLSGGAVALVVGAVVVTRALTGTAPAVSAPAPATVAPSLAPPPAAAEPRAPLAMSARRTAPHAVGSDRARQHARAAADPGGALRDEMQRLDRARAAVRAGDGAQALRDLDGYTARHPRGTFTPEATALRAEALDLTGNHRAATALARRFIAANPAHPLVERLEPIAR